MKQTILLLTILLLGTQSFAQDISASYSNSNFEEIFKVDTLQSIEMWEQPKTQYTPKNLVSEQQMRFNGKEGARTYNSYTVHLTDYDTKLVKSVFKDGKFYVEDNTGKQFSKMRQGGGRCIPERRGNEKTCIHIVFHAASLPDAGSVRECRRGER